MSRHRSISTEISTDLQVAELSQFGMLPVVLYTWAIPHADDWGRMTGDARQFKWLVCPSLDVLVKDVDEALDQIATVGLWERYEVDGKKYIAFPILRWWKHQSYIPKPKREVDNSQFPAPQSAAQFFPPKEDESATPQIAANRRRTPPIPTSPSPSPSPSLTPSPSEGNVSTKRGDVSEADVLPQEALAAPVSADVTDNAQDGLPPRRISDTTERIYWERIVKEANSKDRIPLLVRMAHLKIGVTLAPEAYARIGKLAKDHHSAGRIVTLILDAANEHIAGDPLDYLTKIANKPVRPAQNGHAPSKSLNQMTMAEYRADQEPARAARAERLARITALREDLHS